MKKMETHGKNKKIRRIMMIGIFSLSGLCLLSVGISILTNQFLPETLEQPEVLSPEGIAHAEEALHLLDALGEETWPGLDDQIPLIIWNDSAAFLVNSEDQPNGWDAVSDDEINNLPVYFQQNTADYQAFTEILPNGRYAGSMATKNATNIGFINLFKENLPPVISQIFPYRILLLSTDHYITALVHESFHAFQAENYPERFEDAEKAYPFTDEYENLIESMSEDWQTEVQLLIDAFEEEDPTKQIALVKEFLETRKNRREKVGLSGNLVLYEKRYEWLEGSAKYVELEIWKQAANSDEYQPVDKILSDKDFENYQKYEKRWKNEKTSMKNAAKNIGDSLFYYTGMLQARLLDNLMPDWKSRMGENNIWVEDLLREAVN